VLRSLTVVAFLASTALASAPAAAQKDAGRTLCAVVPDTVPGPTPGQIAERYELRDDVVAVARRHGVETPTGLLFIDLDASRRGDLFFLESNFPTAAVDEATRRVAEYLATVPGGAGYRALVRVDGPYLAPAPGRQHCRPELDNIQDFLNLVHEAARTHPEAGHLAKPVVRTAVVRLVVNREGRVVFAGLENPSGDPVLDPAAVEIAEQLRFLPATLDDEPFDVRIRFPMRFSLR
jgi:TonB family protein